MSDIKSLFQLDPEIHFLNHGSFGACPKPVFDVYQNWQRELERQPVLFFGRRITDLMQEAREGLAKYINCQPDEVVYFPNPTTAVNMVVRNLDLQPGDEVLGTNHEYGAMDSTWRYIAKKIGIVYKRKPMPLPVTTHDDFVEDFWNGVTDKTKIIFISHITSETALIFPVEEICRRAKEAGIMTIIDGAHAPGQIPVDLQKIGADIYTGACHKWLCAPKGSAFLYVRKELQDMLNPLVVSWGYESEQPSGSQYVDYHEWQGTRDMSAFLSVPAAIKFQAEHNWEEVRQRCHRLAKQTRQQINEITGMSAFCPDEAGWYRQMAALELPEGTDVQVFKARLYDEFKVEVPAYTWEERPVFRFSFQGYNDDKDADALVGAVGKILNERSKVKHV